MSFETRTTLTRALAWIELIGMGAALGGMIVLVIATMLLQTPLVTLWNGVLGFTAAAVVSQVAAVILWLWRGCDRCSARLFPLIGGLISGIGRIPKLPDYRAKEVLGSYHLGAVVGMAVAGEVRCIRCGHKDGVAPDYVVTAPE